MLVGLLLSLNALLLCLRKDGDALDVYQQFTVCIDAGHGGVDGGVTGVNTGVKESDLNLSVSRLLKEQFENCGITVVMTRKPRTVCTARRQAVSSAAIWKREGKS